MLYKFIDLLVRGFVTAVDGIIWLIQQLPRFIYRAWRVFAIIATTVLLICYLIVFISSEFISTWKVKIAIILFIFVFISLLLMIGQEKGKLSVDRFDRRLIATFIFCLIYMVTFFAGGFLIKSAYYNEAPNDMVSKATKKIIEYSKFKCATFALNIDGIHIESEYDTVYTRLRRKGFGWDGSNILEAVDWLLIIKHTSSYPPLIRKYPLTYKHISKFANILKSDRPLIYRDTSNDTSLLKEKTVDLVEKIGPERVEKSEHMLAFAKELESKRPEVFKKMKDYFKSYDLESITYKAYLFCWFVICVVFIFAPLTVILFTEYWLQ
jgi:hypothetical protein